MPREKIVVNRTRNCKCCDKRMIRYHVRTYYEINNDPDWAIAICPDCDMIPEKKNA